MSENQEKIGGEKSVFSCRNEMKENDHEFYRGLRVPASRKDRKFPFIVLEQFEKLCESHFPKMQTVISKMLLITNQNIISYAPVLQP